MKQLRVEVRVRNNLLIERREALQMNQVEFAKYIGVSQKVVSAYEVFRETPIRFARYQRPAGWKLTAMKIAEGLGLEPDDLWPEELLRIENARAVRLMNVPEFAALTAPPMQPDRLLDSVGLDTKLATLLDDIPLPRNVDIVRRHFGLGDYAEQTFAEAGKAHKVSRKRAYLMEGMVMRMLRHPSSRRQLKEFRDVLRDRISNGER